MKRFMFLVLFALVSLGTFAQSHRISLNAGSSFIGFNTNVWLKGSLINDAYATTVPVLTYNYLIEDNFGIGGSVAYQYFHLDLLPLNSTSSAVIMKINRFNASIFANYYFLNDDNFDVYMGGKIGRTFWFGNITFEELYSYLTHILPSFISKNVVNRIVPSDLKFFKSFFSYQLFLGGDIFFTHNIGLKIEMATGSPYWALAGLSLKF